VLLEIFFQQWLVVSGQWLEVWVDTQFIVS